MSGFEALDGRWTEILPHFGCSAEYLRNKHGPCPLCGGKDRFRFDDKNGKGTWICNQCGAGTGLALVQELNSWDVKRAYREVSEWIGRRAGRVAAPSAKQLGDPTRRIQAVLAGCRRVAVDDPVDRYLEARGVEPVESLWSHPALEYWDGGRVTGVCPAMVAEIRDFSGALVSLHCTYLDVGRKADVPNPKKVLAPGIKGAAVRLVDSGGVLAITEGIETGLAVHAKTGLATWAAISARGMEAVQVPRDIEIRIFGDNDRNYVGQSAAYALAKRLGERARVFIPPTPGTDWLDVYAT